MQEDDFEERLLVTVPVDMHFDLEISAHRCTWERK